MGRGGRLDPPSPGYGGTPRAPHQLRVTAPSPRYESAGAWTTGKIVLPTFLTHLDMSHRACRPFLVLASVAQPVPRRERPPAYLRSEGSHKRRLSRSGSGNCD